jgi:hypothetical protein
MKHAALSVNVVQRTTMEDDAVVYEVLVGDQVAWRRRVRRSPKRGATPFVKAAREQTRVAARLAEAT